MEHKLTRFKLFANYINELYDIEGLPRLSKTEIQNLFNWIYNNPYFKWIDVRNLCTSSMSNDDVIGFLIIGEEKECHPQADYYIAETYIMPEYRRRHIMSEVIMDFIKTYGGKYCLFIASQNSIAKQFWQKIFQQTNYVQFNLPERTNIEPNPHFLQYGYMPNS